jgi:hypothetical protein
MRHAVIAVAASLVFAVGFVHGCSSASDQPLQSQNGGTIGPGGGEMLGPSGASVTVASGALSSDTALRIDLSTSGHPSLPTNRQAIGQVFAFTPHGQQFGSQVTVKVPFTNGNAGAPELLTAAPSGQWGVVAGATIAGNAIEAKVPHFSFFVVAVATDAGAPVVDSGSANDAASDADGSAMYASGSIDGTWRLMSKICNGVPVDMTNVAATDFTIANTVGSFTNSICSIPVTLSYPDATTVVWVIGQNTCGGVGDTHTATWVISGNTLTVTEQLTPADEFACPSGTQVSTLQK